MSYQPLEKAGLIESCQVSKKEIKGLLGLARRDIKTARELMNLDLDWALIVAYNAASAGRTCPDECQRVSTERARPA